MDETRLDAYVDDLVAEGVLDVDEETDAVRTTDAFEQDRLVYYDSYLDADDEAFHGAVAEAFGLDSADEAAERVERLDVTRREFATYLTLNGRLDGYPIDDLAVMAGLVVDVGPESPVPDAVTELDDDSYADFVADNDRAVVTVWKTGCDPCEGMKSELDEVLAAFPDDAAVGGLDGEQCPGFCGEFEVNAAPAVVLFRNGTPIDVVTGRTSPGPLADRCAEQFGTA